MGKIVLNVINYEMVYDQLDTSCFNIIFEGGYFNIQSSVYIDPDFEYSEIAYFELSGQENGRYLDPEKIIFHPKRIIIILTKVKNFWTPFKKYTLFFLMK